MRRSWPSAATARLWKAHTHCSRRCLVCRGCLHERPPPPARRAVVHGWDCRRFRHAKPRGSRAAAALPAAPSQAMLSRHRTGHLPSGVHTTGVLDKMTLTRERRRYGGKSTTFLAQSSHTHLYRQTNMISVEPDSILDQ